MAARLASVTASSWDEVPFWEAARAASSMTPPYSFLGLVKEKGSETGHMALGLRASALSSRPLCLLLYVSLLPLPCQDSHRVRMGEGACVELAIMNT